jgi:prolyl-tRNA editing enzyme YbaK/EbsC (Cys-tRNA(Pro) deacylase)
VNTVVDVSLSRHRHVWAAAGHSHTVFRTTYEELLRVTGGHAIEVA